MNVPFVDLKREANFCFNELSASFEDVVKSGSYINGRNVIALEERICSYLGVDHCVSVGNGSDALVFILRSLAIGDGDEVICPGNSFIATSWAIRAVGAIPIFCDVSEDLLFSKQSFYSSISPRTRAFIPVHLTGRVCDLQEIRSFCDLNSIHLIEDAAQSFGARNSSGSFTGSIGDAAAFSLHPLKNFAVYGDGGLITTNDSSIADSCRLLRNHGLSSRDSAQIWGYNSRLDELQAAFALVKLNYIKTWTTRYIEIAKLYNSLLTSQIIKPHFRSNFTDVYHNYVIRVPIHIRDTLQDSLRSFGIDTKVHYPIPLHKQPCYVGEFGNSITLANVESFADQMISLPIYPLITDNEVKYVCETLNRLFNSLSNA